MQIAEKLLEDHGPSPGEGFGWPKSKKGEFIFYTVNPVWVAKLHASQKNRKSLFYLQNQKEPSIVRNVERNIKI